jgi:acetyl-CoA C-acetyltransferase
MQLETPLPIPADVDPRTPILVGVGQVAERIGGVDYDSLSPVALAAAAARAAIADCGVEQTRELIDTVVATRQFENSSPYTIAPLGRSTKFPLSVARAVGCPLRRAILEVSGGQSPQRLVTEFAREISGGYCQAVLLVGAEAISTIRHLADADPKPDFSEDPDDPDCTFEDRGYGLEGMVTEELIAHGMTTAPAQYALLENARRAALGMSRADYAVAMGQLFSPFTRVASENPYAAAPHYLSVEELITVTERNRMIADPYPRLVVARDQVNQAAAVLITSVGAARRLGIDSDRWVYLQGQAELRERHLLDRPSLATAPSAVMAVHHALDVAGLASDDIDYFDLYSCFPIAVSNIIDGLNLSPDDPRGFTLTGGLPYFGGAGNNYSMHAIVEAVQRVRSNRGSSALVSANGGILSKTSVGIYGTTPTPIRPDRSAELQARIDVGVTAARERHATGWATIETFTVRHGRSGKVGVVVGRLDGSGRRFIARVDDHDAELLDVLEHAAQPIGQRLYVTARDGRNIVRRSAPG